jgi:hypothetical protein
MHGFFIFSKKYTKFAGLELIEKNKCLKNKKPANINQEQPRRFSSWFDTPYHHKERNNTEAQFFMDNITTTSIFLKMLKVLTWLVVRVVIPST